jgi:hypothetical protein
MTKDEALRLALEALEDLGMKHYENTGEVLYKETFTAIKAALEANEFNPDWDTQAVLVEEIQRMAKRIEELEAKGEPVAWYRNEDGIRIYYETKAWDDCIPLYTIPPQRTWVGLTDEEIAEVEDEYIVDYRIPAGSAWNFAKDIEAKLKEKNT